MSKKRDLKKEFFKLLKNSVRFIIPLAIGVLLIWFLYRNIDLGEIWEVLTSGVNIYWVVLSIIAGILSHVLRAIRWQLQLQVLGAHPSLKMLCNAIFGTYALNLVFPRLGEVWRSNYISQSEKISFSKVLGSIISDRLCDAAAITLICLAVVLSQLSVFGDFLGQFPNMLSKVQALFSSPWLYIGLGIVVLAIILLLRSNNAFSIMVKKVVANLIVGIKTILFLKHKLFFVLYTIGLWGFYFLQLYLISFAFDFTADLGIAAMLVLFVMTSLSVAIPVQGGIGPWHFATITTLMFYGVGHTHAAAFALIVHTINLILVIVLGIYAVAAVAIEKKALLTTPQS